MPTGSRAPGPPPPPLPHNTPTASRICFLSRTPLNNKCLSLSAFSVWWKKKSRGLRRMTPRAGAARSSRSSRSCYSSTLWTTPVVDIRSEHRRCTIHSPGGQLAQCKMDYSAFTRAHSRVFFPLPSYTLCCRKGAGDFFLLSLESLKDWTQWNPTNTRTVWSFWKSSIGHVAEIWLPLITVSGIFNTWIHLSASWATLFVG